MYVCLCNGITERQIKNAVEKGDSNLSSVKHRLGVSNQCGSCANMAESIILNHKIHLDQVDLFYKVA